MTMEGRRPDKDVMIARLQISAQLTLEEARAILCEGETPEDLSKEFGTTVNAIYNMQRRAKKKIAMTGYSIGEICHNDLGIIFCGPEE